MEIKIADYSIYPGPRYISLGDFSGEDFYSKILGPEFEKALSKNEKLSVILDNTAGYASSFLDEAFGSLVYYYTLETVKNNINIISTEEPDWKDMIEKETFVEWEQRRLKGEAPKKTAI